MLASLQLLIDRQILLVLALVAVAVALSACGDTLSDTGGEIDTAVPNLSVDPIIVIEGDASSPGVASFNLSLNKDAVNASVDYQTLNDSAIGGDDYVFSSGTVHFEQNSRSATIEVDLIGDATIESGEKFLLLLGNEENLNLANISTYADIIDDDLPTTLSISADAVFEGADAEVVFQASMDYLTDGVSFAYQTQDDSAVAGSDYQQSNGTVQFADGATEASFSVALLDDSEFESEESFALAISDVKNAVFSQTSISATILDDDVPILQVADASVDETNLHHYNQMTFTLTADSLYSSATVDYELVSYSATAGSDFSAASGSLTFDQQLTQYLEVDIFGDHEVEANEQFFLQFSSPVDLSIGNSDYRAIGTIIDNDSPAILSLSSSSVRELDNGETNTLRVTLKLDNYTEGVGLAYSTADGSATAYSDYQPESGIWQLDYDRLSMTMSLTVVGDQMPEGEENFLVQLGTISGAELGSDSDFSVSIDDDDGEIAASCLSSPSVLDFGTVSLNNIYSKNINLVNSCSYALQLDADQLDLPAVFSLNPDSWELAANSSADWELSFSPDSAGVVRSSLWGKFDISAIVTEQSTLPYYAGAVVSGSNALSELSQAYALAYGPGVDELYVSGYSGGGLFVYDAASFGLKQRIVTGEYGYNSMTALTWIEYNPVYDELLVFGGSYSQPFVVLERNASTGLFYQSQSGDASAWVDGQGSSPSRIDVTSAALSADGESLFLIADNDPSTFVDDLLVAYQRSSTTGEYIFQAQRFIGENAETGWDTSFRLISYLHLDSTETRLWVTRSIRDSVQIYQINDNLSMQLLQSFSNGADGISSMDSPRMVVSSPDNRFAYVAASSGNSINIFSQQDDGSYQHHSEVQDDEALSTARYLQLTKSGSQLLVATPASAGISVFNRDSLDGSLSELMRFNSSTHPQVPALSESMVLAINDNEDRVFLSQYGADAVHGLYRDPDSGYLFFDQLGVSLATDSGFRGVRDPIGIVTASSGDYAYVISGSESAVAVLGTSADGIEQLVNTYDSSDFASLSNPSALVLSADDDQLIVMSNAQRRLGIFDIDSGSLTENSVFYFSDHSPLLDNYNPHSLALTQDNTQLLVMLEDSGSNELLVLDRANEGALSNPQLIDSSSQLDSLSQFIVNQADDTIYAIIESHNGDYGRLVIFDRDTSTGAISYFDSIAGEASGENGLKAPRSIAESDNGRYLLVVGQSLVGQSQNVNALSILETQSNLSLRRQFNLDEIDLLTYDDVHVAVDADSDQAVLFSPTGGIGVYPFNQSLGSFDPNVSYSYNETINTGSVQRGFANITAVAFRAGGDYLYTAGRDSHAVGLLKLK